MSRLWLFCSCEVRNNWDREIRKWADVMRIASRIFQNGISHSEEECSAIIQRNQSNGKGPRWKDWTNGEKRQRKIFPSLVLLLSDLERGLTRISYHRTITISQELFSQIKKKHSKLCEKFLFVYDWHNCNISAVARQTESNSEQCTVYKILNSF